MFGSVHQFAEILYKELNRIKNPASHQTIEWRIYLLESIIPFLNLLNDYFFSEVSFQTSENQVTIDYAKKAIIEFSSVFFENMENLYSDKLEEIA